MFCVYTQEPTNDFIVVMQTHSLLLLELSNFTDWMFFC